MRKKLFLIVFVIIVSLFVVNANRVKTSGAPPYGVSEEGADEADLSWLAKWRRPDVPAKVAIQVGHYKNDDFPDELANLRDNNGAESGGVTEVEVNQAIANLIANYLESKGVYVEILPATVPQNYWADVFLAIHADGSEDADKSGYKFATSWRDLSGNADELIEFLVDEYEPATGLVWDDNITRNMRGYYAFAWWRYDHSIHPMTTPVIVETGFLTNESDRNLLVNSPEIPADAISRGVIKYLESKNLISN